ncbi:SdrD B-like domain-containing protein [Variovorax sp. J22P240]|uniref:SdrD B-like domain-containing protein n=1 Tax=Variovorax sp. J22P240 TaxID=3053514 RepID=UPI002576BB70|nr:SdrD B-like domain-containing protein [Variovorax sp. J22P240]MDM0000103.1 SdrD B-like domain-containing protein [Variovorax sp. J22P240]
MAAGGGNAWAQAGPVARPEAATYVDRVLDESSLPAPIDETEAPASTGWPRGWSAEAQATNQNSGGVDTRSQSLLLNGFLDTPNYGALSVNANLNRNPAQVSGFSLEGSTGLPTTLVPFSYRTGSTWRIDQRAMPLDGGWYANNSLGSISMANSPLARGIGRVFLPGLPIEGVAASIEQPGRTTLNASAGRLGVFDGISFQGFTTSQGTAASAGAQTQIAGGEGPLGLGRTDAAVQLMEARDVNTNGVAGFAQNTRSVWTAASWQGVAPWADALGTGFGGVGEKIGGLRVQANLLQSSGRPSDSTSLAPRDSATGGWVDATWRTELMQQSASIFRFDPALRWGNESLPNDIQGASWRGDISTRQWQVGTNIELSDSVSGLGRRSTFGNVFGRYRFDSRDAVSSTLAARTGSFAAQSAQVTWEHKSDWGYSQWRTDVAHGTDLRVVRTGVDHAWEVNEAQTLSTTLAFEQSSDTSFTARTALWGVLGTTPLAAGARLDLSVRGSNGIGNNPTNFLSANVRLTWALGQGWSLIAQYTDAHGRESLNPAVVSALTAATIQPVLLAPSTRSFMVALRFEERAGLASTPIGGAPGVGSGRLEGHVFLDQNNNGQREANEGGVPGVTVVLNGRFVARTDAQGFYSFPSVAAGSHEIEIVPDNLPLPWSNAGPPVRRVDVFVRGTASADFAIQRDR